VRRYHVTVGGKVHVVDVQEVSATEFHVAVKGQELEVTLSGAEEVPETVISPEIVPTRPGPLPGVPPASAFKPAHPETLPPLVSASPPQLPHAPDVEATAIVKAPMPGTITAVEVKAGDDVTVGQVLVKLEAMKMINAIKAPQAGRVAAVPVRPGQSVGYGDDLVAFEEA
jgi:glutaconyl-CoA decarboxylase